MACGRQASEYADRSRQTRMRRMFRAPRGIGVVRDPGTFALQDSVDVARFGILRSPSAFKILANRGGPRPDQIQKDSGISAARLDASLALASMTAKICARACEFVRGKISGEWSFRVLRAAWPNSLPSRRAARARSLRALGQRRQTLRLAGPKPRQCCERSLLSTRESTVAR